VAGRLITQSKLSGQFSPEGSCMAVALPAINQSGAGAKKPHNFGCGVPLALGVIKLHLFRGSASLLQITDGARA